MRAAELVIGRRYEAHRTVNGADVLVCSGEVTKTSRPLSTAGWVVTFRQDNGVMQHLASSYGTLAAPVETEFVDVTDEWQCSNHACLIWWPVSDGDRCPACGSAGQE